MIEFFKKKIQILAALGFTHMQSSFDRDAYVTINYKNIKPKMVQNFDKRNDVRERNSKLKWNTFF